MSLGERIKEQRKSCGMSQEKLAAFKAKLKKNVIFALRVTAGYFLFYLIGRFIWCDREYCTFLAWLFSVHPSGEHSYLYGWLLSSNMFYITAAISLLPSLLGKHLYSITTLSGFTVGFLAGVIFGPNPKGAAIGHTHYGWAIWGVIFFASVIVGIVLEILKKRGLIKK